MPLPRLLAKTLLAASMALAATPMAAQDLPQELPSAGDLALMGTIPIYWGETDGLSDLLAGEGEPHWARPVIERHYRLRPLDYISDVAVAGYSRLLLAQPRGFSGEENVALDAWVRAGGRALLFADPLMTGHSRFAIGDWRRPQDVALLSPILTHWGLELRFDETQAEGRQMRDSVPPADFPSLPVEMPGELVVSDTGADCALFAEGIAAECRLGEGVVLVVADAALFDADGADYAAQMALQALLTRIFGNPVPPPTTDANGEPKY